MFKIFFNRSFYANNNCLTETLSYPFSNHITIYLKISKKWILSPRLSFLTFTFKFDFFSSRGAFCYLLQTDVHTIVNPIFEERCMQLFRKTTPLSDLTKWSSQYIIWNWNRSLWFDQFDSPNPYFYFFSYKKKYILLIINQNLYKNEIYNEKFCLDLHS